MFLETQKRPETNADLKMYFAQIAGGEATTEIDFLNKF